MLTPEQYINEMHAIGWRPLASVLRGQPQHVIERGPADSVEMNRTWPAFCSIQQQVDPNDLTFWPAVSKALFDAGAREEVGPRCG